jgi:hypothetical protein
MLGEYDLSLLKQAVLYRLGVLIPIHMKQAVSLPLPS